MTKAEKRERILAVIEELKRVYPTAECALEYGGDPWRLLVMGRLSAQCTDARVNITSRELFEKFPTAESMANAPLSEIEEIIKPCGLYKMKAKNLKDASIMLVNEFSGELPQQMDELLRLPGVGRKIANLLIGDLFGGPAIVCDTHCMRICGRLGMYRQDLRDPIKIEKILRELVPAEEGADFCHRIVYFGRDVCRARNPLCRECPLKKHCVIGEKDGKNQA